MSDVKWPAKAVDDEATDLAAPTAELLRRLYVLESKEDAEKGPTLFGTPHSLQVITAGALSATKVTGLFAGVGGVAAAAGAAWAAFQAEETAVRVALVASVTVILAAALIAVAMVVRGDVQHRSDATVAQYRARASIAGTFLGVAALAQNELSGSANAAPAPPPDVDRALLPCIAAFKTAVKPKELPGFEVVTGLRRLPSGVQVRLESGDWIGLPEVEQFTSVSPR